MAKVIVFVNERPVEIELDERTISQVTGALNKHITNNLIDPNTRTIYPAEIEIEKQIRALGKALLGKTDLNN